MEKIERASKKLILEKLKTLILRSAKAATS